MAYKDNTGDWMFFAQSDLKTARVMLDEGVYHMSCFHAQQTIEKCLKAILRHHQKPIVKTHSLAKLTHDVMLLGIKDFIDEDIPFVDQFYSPTRYPDTLPGSLPEGLPMKDDAQQAVRIAENVFESTSKLISSG